MASSSANRILMAQPFGEPGTIAAFGPATVGSNAGRRRS
jgi:hypothetical protein